MGDILTISGDDWAMTGFPAVGGTVKESDGRLQLIIERVGKQTREEAIGTEGAVGVAEALKKLDAQLVFELATADGKLTLRQVGKSSGLAELRFLKKQE